MIVAVIGFGSTLLNVWPEEFEPAILPALPSSAEKRETVLDRRVHLEPGLLEVPHVPPLCDELKLEKRRVQVGDCELYCETEGKGLPLVLINGGPGGTHHGFHPYFGRAAEFAKVMYYDQRGCGQSDYRKGSGYTITQAVNDLENVRQALKLDRWVVLGWSYGGVLAQCYALRHPERVRGLVLVGSGEDGIRLKLEPAQQFAVWTAEEEKRIAEIYASRSLPLAQMLYNKDINGDWKRQHYYKPTREEFARGALYGCKYDPAFRRGVEQDLQHLYLRGMFEGCPVPILLLEGKHDLTWGADKPAKLHACFPGSRLILFEASAHAPFEDDTTSRGGQASLEKIAQQYSAKWLPRISDADALLRLGFAMALNAAFRPPLLFLSCSPTARPKPEFPTSGHSADLTDS